MVFDKAYFDAGINRIGTGSAKWDEMRRDTGDPDMLPMWVADMDFPSPPAVQQALARVAAQGTWGYTHETAGDREALTAFWQRRHGVTLRPEDVLMSPCVVTGLRVSVLELTAPGDGVLIHSPVYGPFYDAIRDSGRRVVESPLVQGGDGRYAIDFEDTRAKLASGEAKAVLFCSPHNPAGRAWTREELTRLVSICREAGAAIVCDEIHADFVYAPARHESILTIPGAEDAVLLCAASKTFNIAGLKQSAVCCQDAERLSRLRRRMETSGIVSGNIFALAATRAAYTESDAWLDGLIPYLAANRDAVMAHAGARWPKIRIAPLEATYLMWLDCRALGLSQEALMDKIRAAHVFVNDGLFFGEGGRGFVRLNIACPRAQVDEALRRLDGVFAE